MPSPLPRSESMNAMPLPARRRIHILPLAFVAVAGGLISCRSPSREVVTTPRQAQAQALAQAQAQAQAHPALSFAIREGKIENRLFRDGRVAAHLVTTSGEAPRIVVAFPAGNMGVGVWFDETADLSVDGEPSAVERADGMRGIAVTLRSRAPSLRLRRALLGSVRMLRDCGRDGKVPPEIKNEVVAGSPVVLRRTTLDGHHHLELAFDAKDGSKTSVGPNGDIVVAASAKGEIAIRLTALADDEPLTPMSASDIVTADAADDPRALSALTFLTYEQKLLAGSWQYLTYFGRDTLLSTRLLMPVLQPTAIEAALGAVIDRLSADGEVTHEEDIGEWAVLQNMARSPRPGNVREPIYDRKMVDDDFLLAPVLAAYVLDSAEGARRAPTFFARRTSSGRTFATAIRKNLERVIAQAEPFAARPTQQNLIHIGADLAVGNWRDSIEGLGNGRVPYDINAALVPAALRAAERLYAAEPFGRDQTAAGHAGDLGRAWSKAEPLFRVRVETDEARRRVRAYAAEQGIDARDAILAIKGPVTFPAVSLDAKGVPVPIQHSDDGFVMMFAEPSAEWLTSAASRVVDPFPAGLRTPVGVVVANPAYATDPALRGIFTRDHYHGTVVWSWQQAMLLAGVRRQLGRADLPTGARSALQSAEAALARVIDDTRATRTSELWSFSVDAGGFHVVPFGQSHGHHTEANAVQLWSTVFLALDRRPDRH